jgi:hypothetical protein
MLCIMTQSDQSLAAAKIRRMAERNNWPVISDEALNFVTPQLARVSELWHEKRQGRVMPARGDFNLRDLKDISPNLAFGQVVREGKKIRLRAKLVGTELDHFIGGRATGKFLDEIVPPRFAQKWAALWMPAMEHRVPTRTVGRVEYADKKFFISEAFRAPLSEDGETVDTLMLVDYFHYIRSNANDDPLVTRLAQELGPDRCAAPPTLSLAAG